MVEIIGFDTNILIYAFNIDDKEKHNQALELLERVNKGEFIGFLSIQNLNELFYVIAKKRLKSLNEGEEIVTSLLNSNNWIIKPLTGETTKIAIGLTQKNKNHFWDNLIAANLILNGIKEIFTENVLDFKGNSFKVTNPFK